MLSNRGVIGERTFRVIQRWIRVSRTGQQHKARWYSRRDSMKTVGEWSTPFKVKDLEFDWEYLCSPCNLEEIKKNIQNRKGVGDIDTVVRLWKEVQEEKDEQLKNELKKQLLAIASGIPNKSNPLSPVDGSAIKIVDTVGTKKDFSFQPRNVVELGENMGLLRTQDVGITTGHKSYYFIGDMARLQRALVRFAVDRILEKGFLLVTVPEIISSDVVERCGFPTSGERTQVYKLDSESHEANCLVGTAEIPLAGYFSNEILDASKLPIKIAAVSQCYRPEISNLEVEGGIYRVHQFMKVEMFGVTASESGEESSVLLEELVGIQKELYSDLGLHFRVLDMPCKELGAPANRKFDIEAWMPAKGFWGEISSASNCTDFQSRRLNIKYRRKDGLIQHVHTVNGTACAVPRMIMAIMENNQTLTRQVHLPAVLHSYFDGQKKLVGKELGMKWIKSFKNN